VFDIAFSVTGRVNAGEMATGVDINTLSHEELKEKFKSLFTDFSTVKVNEEKLKGTTDKLKGEAVSLHERVKELEADASKSAGTKAKERVVYVANDRKIEKLRGAPKSGSRDPEVDEWIVDVEGVINSRKLSDNDAVQYIKDHLGGDARTEIQSRNPDNVTKPAEIFRILREVFEFGETLPQLRRRFYSRIQEEGESILQFSHALSRLHRRMEQMDPGLVNERDEVMKSQMVDGVKDPELQKEALRWTKERKGTFFGLREWASEWTRQGTGTGLTGKKTKVSIKETSIESLKTGNEPILEAIKKQNEMLQQQLKAQEELTKTLRELKLAQGPNVPQGAQGSENSDFRPRCFDCGSHNHFRRDCPQNESNHGNVNQNYRGRGGGRGRYRGSSRGYRNNGQQSPRTDDQNEAPTLNQ
jgi:FtsZ-binding cell division protein ZapB